jgi:hypothetical protein
MLYTRLLEANNIANLATGDNTKGSVQISNPEGKIRVFCCEQAASYVIGTSCEIVLDPNVKAAARINTAQSRKPISAERLAKRWGIGDEKVKNTLKETTQLGICQMKHPVE